MTITKNISATTITKQDPLPIDEIARFPLPGMSIPDSLAFRPDNKEISYLASPDGGLTTSLYAFDLQTGSHTLLADPPGGGTTETNISREEALRRERQRQRGLGITQYLWAPHSNRLLIPIRGDLYTIEEPGSPLQLLLDAGGKPALDPKFSPDGMWISYVQDNELFIIPSTGGTPRQLTDSARESGKVHGLAEYVAQEEMGRSSGYWWAPDSQSIAFTEVDETHIPIYRIVHQGKNELGDSAQEDHRYPFAGKENACVHLGVQSVNGGEPVWMDYHGNPDDYLVRVHWLPDGRLTAQWMNRLQNELILTCHDPATGTASVLLRETSPLWVNLNDLFYPLEREPGNFLWGSERTGFRHLYLYGTDGNLIRTLTTGEWMVETLAGVDEKNQCIYFTATAETPLESHLYCVSLLGGEIKRITHEPGMHSIVIDHACQQFTDTYSTVFQPPRVVLRSIQDGSQKTSLYEQTDPRIAELKLTAPEMISFETKDGIRLFGAIYHPPAAYGPGPFPTVVQVYGGPHAQSVDNSWKMVVQMRAQYLRSLGILVFILDNRGSARRGLMFEAHVHHNMGDIEVQDQTDGVKWLVEQGLTKPERVGVYGWSYGGYMAAMCLLRAPEIFKAAVIGAPVTQWDGYDTFYTERYMGTPQTNPSGYEKSSVMHHVHNLTGKLMLVHGLIDENVHFRHTARLINALIKARKPYDLLLFPDERHMPRKESDRIYMEERIRDFFIHNL